MSTKLLKPKAKQAPSHNKDIQTLVEAVQKTEEVPFQVRLDESLVTQIKLHCVKNKISHKQAVIEAMTDYLRKA